MRTQWGIEKPEMAKGHVVFQDADRATCIGAGLQTSSSDVGT